MTESAHTVQGEPLVDFEAEKALALTLANRPEAWDYVAHLLAPDMLGSPQPRAIVRAVQRLVADGTKVTPTSIATALGGAAIPRWNDPALARTPPEAEALAKRVRAMWVRRQVRDLGTTLLEASDTSAAIVHAQQVLAQLESTGSRASTGDAVVQRRIDELERSVVASSSGTERAPRYDLGFRDLDHMLGGLRTGRLAVFAARPSNGKSAFAVALADNLAASGVPVGVFWLEDEEEDFADRLMTRHYNLRANDLRPGNGPGLQRVFSAVLGSFNEQHHRRIVVDDTHALTVQDVAARMRRMHREHGCRVFIADHLGEVLVRGDDRWGGRHDLALGLVVRTYRDTAKELGAVPVLCVQMNRRVEHRGSSDTSPRMSDLDGSGQIEQAARVVAFLERALDDQGDSTGEFKVRVVKNTSGATGTVVLRWNAETASVEAA